MRFGVAHFVVAVDGTVVLAVKAVNAITGIGYPASATVVVGIIVAAAVLAIRHYDRYWERKLANANNQ